MSPKQAFRKQQSNAEARGIEWRLSFDEWWSVWEQYFHLRGRGKNALCMARLKDDGPYSLGNVYLTTNLGNGMDKRESVKADARRAAKRQAEIDRGGAPTGYAWKRPKKQSCVDRGATRSEAMKQRQTSADYLACIADGDVLE